MVWPDKIDITVRPGLAYQHAFDWLAVQLHGTVGPTACLVSGFLQGVELLCRLPTVAFLDPIPVDLVVAAIELGLPRVASTGRDRSLSAAAWVEPRSTDSGQLESLADRLAPGGHLYVVAGGPLARFLAERRTNNENFLAASIIQERAEQNGFRLQDTFGIHGLRSIAWFYASEVSNRFGRHDWQDRCHFAMRRDFVIAELSHSLAALRCLTLERLP